MSQEISAPEAAPGNKMPSVMRYDRVQAILEGDPSLKDMLGPKDQEVKKRNGEKHFYSRGAVLVTNTLHERQFDAHNVDKNIVIALALELLPEKAAKLAAPKPVKKPAPKPVAKPVEKPKPEPKPEPKPRPQPKKPEAKTPKAPVKQEPSAPPQAAAPATVPVADASTAPAAAVDSKPAFVYYIYGNALSLAVALAKMLEVGDRLPGAEQRQQAANDIIDLLIPLRDMPVPMPKDLMPAVMQNVKASVSSKG